jgi:hypothetical protein
MATRDEENSRLFLLGRVVTTEGAADRASEEELRCFLHRHQVASWEETPPMQRHANWVAFFNGFRIFSVHESARGPIWIITEGDRSSTTILTPEES